MGDLCSDCGSQEHDGCAHERRPITPGPLLADYLDKQRKANPVVGPWVEMDDSARKVVLDWLIGTCLTFGASIGTAYQVAGLFAAGLDREAAANASKAGDAR